MRKHPLARCEECVFKNAPFVPTQNPHPRARLAVIGEAPGSYEAGRGIPFTGPSGRLLDQVLSHHGYERSEVMVTNVCLCRPTDNADPPKSAIACCAPRLEAEIASSGVEKILAVGGTSAATLIDPKKKISTLRIGPPKPYIKDPQVEVVATWHPAFCLRAPDHFPTFVTDTGKLRGRSELAPWTWGTYKIFDDLDNTLKAIERLHSVPGPLVIDIETGLDKDEEFEHPDHYELLCIGISYSPTDVVVIGTNALKFTEVQLALAILLMEKRVIGHNIKSDLAGLYPLFGRIIAAGDTMLQSYAQDERPGHHSLGKLGIEKLGTPDWKAEFKRLVPSGGNYGNAPRAALYYYNAKDVMATRRLNDDAMANMNEREHKIHAFLVQAANAVVDLERAGIAFDVEYSKNLQLELEYDLKLLEDEISNTTGRALNPRSPKQILKWFEDQNMHLRSSDASTMEAILERGSAPEKIQTFIHQLLKHRRGAKLNGTYVKGFQKRIYQGKIFTTYTLHGTTSGRLASRNPNMQNIVRDKRIKNQFTVENWANILIQGDYKQAEGRTIATLAKDEYLAGLFRDPDKDIFNDMCYQIWGNDYGKEERVKIKSVFYGLAYGREAASIGVELGISFEEASQLLREFKALIPETVSWQASITHKVLSGEDLITPFGRKRSFWLITDHNKKDVINEALSFLPQSIASDICLRALIRLQPRLEGLATTRLTIHDAMIFEAREEDAEEVIKIATEEMVRSGEEFTDYVPFEVDFSMGKRWSEL